MFREVVEQPVIVFTGAGASAALKLRTTAEMDIHIQEIEQAIKKSGISNIYVTRLAHVAHYYFAKQESEPLDLEEFLSFLMKAGEMCNAWEDSAKRIFWNSIDVLNEFFNALHRAPIIDHLIEIQRDVLPGLINSTYEMIRDHYSTINGKPAIDGGDDAYTHYKPLIDLIEAKVRWPDSQRVIPWFTTNYDWVIEKACDASAGNWVLRDGFGVGPESEYNPDNFAITGDTRQVKIALFKLHGSTSWRRYPGDLTRAYKSEAPPNHVPIDQLAIVYPRLGIEKEDIKYSFFMTGYEYLRECLTKAKLVLIIGFSLRDQHVAQLLAKTIVERPELKVVYVDMHDSEEIDETIAKEWLEIDLAKWENARIPIAHAFPSPECIRKIEEAFDSSGF